MRDNYKEIGDFIKLIRKNTKLTQIDLSRLAGVNQATISRIEKGNRYITKELYESVLNVLNLSLDIKYKIDLDLVLQRLYVAFEENDQESIQEVYQFLLSIETFYYKEFPIYQLIMSLYYYIKLDKKNLNESIKQLALYKPYFTKDLSMRFSQVVGIYYMLSDRFNEALPFLHKAFMYCEDHLIKDGLLYYQYGWIHFFLGNHTTSILAIDKARRIYTKTNNELRLFNINNLFGLIHMNDGNYDEAHDIFLDCLHHQSFLHAHPSNYYIVVRNLGLNSFFNNHYNESIYYLEKLYKEKKYHNKVTIFFLLLSLKMNGDHKKYKQYIKECKENKELELEAKKIISFFENNPIHYIYNNSLIKELEKTINKYNIYNVTYWMINNYAEEIYNHRRYSTYKNMFDLFIEARLKV